MLQQNCLVGILINWYKLDTILGLIFGTTSLTVYIECIYVGIIYQQKEQNRLFGKK